MNTPLRLHKTIIVAALGFSATLCAHSALAGQCSSDLKQTVGNTTTESGVSIGGDINANDTPSCNIFVQSEQSNLTPAYGGGLVFTPSTLSFAATPVGGASAAQTISVSNTDTFAFDINGIFTAGDFAYTSNCPISFGNGPSISDNAMLERTAFEREEFGGGDGSGESSVRTLNAGASCTILASFKPTALGTRTGKVDINTNSNLGNVSITASGIGISNTDPTAFLSPGVYAYQSQTVNSTSEPLGVILQNDGAATLAMSAPTFGNPAFALGKAIPTITLPVCGVSLGAGKQCYYSVVFTPTAVGKFSGLMSITDNAVGSPHTVSLSGVGTAIPQPAIAVPATITFADQIFNTASAAQTVPIGNITPQQVTVSNTGLATLTINSITLSGANAADYVVSGNCVTVLPGASCNLSVVFRPNENGVRNATITINSNSQLLTGTTSTNTVVNLSGRGVPTPVATARLSATSLGFGNVIYGSSASSQRVNVSNVGSLPLTISSISASGNSDFIATNTCTAALVTGASCNIDITFSPRALGARSSVLSIISNSPNSPNTVQIGGTGCRYFSPAAARFFLTIC